MALKPLFVLDKGLDSGIWPFLHSRRNESIWEDGRNVIFRDGGVAKTEGRSTGFNTGVTEQITGLGQLLDNSSQKLFFGTRTNLYMWNTATVSQLGSGYTGLSLQTVTSPATLWHFENFGNWMIATNGVDPVQVWKGSGSFTALANTTFTRAEIILRRKTHLLAFNTSNGREMIEWCSSDNPEEWTQSAANTAGALQLRDLESGIVAAAPIGDQIAVFSNDQMQLVRYTGAPFVFSVAQAIQSIGALSKKAVASVGRLIYGVGQQGFWVSDGVTAQYIDDLSIRKWFFNRLNWGQSSKINCYHNEKLTQIIWSYPIIGQNEPTEAVGYDYNRKVWTVYDRPFTSGIERQVIQYPVTGTSNGQIYFNNFGVSDNGNAFTAYAVTKAVDFNAPDRQKWIQGVKLNLLDYVSDVWVRFGTQQRLDDAVVWSQTFTVSAGHSLVDVRPYNISGRWCKMMVGSTAPNAKWLLQGFIVYGQLFGNYS